MKQPILAILFSLCCFLSRGQRFSISADKMNVLYIGVSNPLSIIVENIPSNSIIVKSDNGTITGNNGRYEFQGGKVGRTQITLYKKINGKIKEIGKGFFRVKQLPLPIFKIASGKDRMPKVEIANQQYVRAELEDFDIDIRYNIDSFKVCIVSSDTCKFSVKTNYGNKISEEILNEFKMLKQNDVVVFKDIFIKQPDGTQDMLAPRIITIY
jgi:GldM C-terminal domain